MNVNEIVCFGEVLWDQLPGANVPGGAPLNVAYHLQQLGIPSAIISRVGEDKEGEKIKNLIQSKGVTTAFIGTDTNFATGTVQVEIDKSGNIFYDIVFPVAWDFIPLSDRAIEKVAKSAIIVFGSLSSRNKISADTLEQLLKHAQKKVLDINLRKPFFDVPTIKKLMNDADVLKMNGEELSLLAQWLLLKGYTEEAWVQEIREKFDIAEVVVTHGANGASYFGKEFYYSPAENAPVADTVGSGDAFLAGFLAQYIQEKPIQVCMDFANKIAGFVTSRNGACPEYTETFRNQIFIKKN